MSNQLNKEWNPMRNLHKTIEYNNKITEIKNNKFKVELNKVCSQHKIIE